ELGLEGLLAPRGAEDVDRVPARGRGLRPDVLTAGLLASLLLALLLGEHLRRQALLVTERRRRVADGAGAVACRLDDLVLGLGRVVGHPRELRRRPGRRAVPGGVDVPAVVRDQEGAVPA